MVLRIPHFSGGAMMMVKTSRPSLGQNKIGKDVKLIEKGAVIDGRHENNGRGERDRWERRRKEFDGKGKFLGRETYGEEGNISGEGKNLTGDGIVLILEKLKNLGF
ncbi:hypothetical protein H5410_038966 [Solanum commersonii]|uniref:Uncharacterized protein n=1 Tax=Solanum commersonii TaxID=4109 RepID=A0A9J5YFD8_SOLCO|nr:hypothetical protein H5410_038966 [Solanum commersonii]